MPQKKSFSEELAIISDEEQGLIQRSLKALSALEPEQLAQFQNAWPNIATERRREIATALLELGEEEADLDFSPVFLAMLRDADAEVRGIAIDGLWEFEDKDILKELIPIMESDPSEKVREKATLGMSRFALLAELGKLTPRWVTKIYDALLVQAKKENSDFGIRRRALEALGYFTQSEEVRDLITKAFQSDDALLKASALLAMGRTVDKRWLPEIGKSMSSETPALRYEAARAAGEIASLEMVPALFKLVRDPDAEVRLTAIWALGQVGGPDSMRLLKSLANSDSETLRNAVREALVEIEFSKNPLNVLPGTL